MFGYLQDAGFREVDVFPHAFHEHAGRRETFVGVVSEFVGILQSGRAGVVERAQSCDAATYDQAIRDLTALTSEPGGTFTYAFMRCRAVK
jgi:hypothetical protein